ncbi:MAG: hypothetical protein AAF316_00310 [Cyanobacteria bacterium P01_A01_bin.80]
MTYSSSNKTDSKKTTQTYSTSTSNKPKTPLPLKILHFCLTLVIGAFIFANIKPYEIISAKFLGSFDYPVLGAILFNTPLIGGLFKFFASLFSFTLGTAMWAVFQILEILPLVLFGHGRFLNNQVSKHGKAGKYTHSRNDGWETKAAKFLGNSLSTEVMRFLVLMAIGVYVLDFLLILTVYPPVNGNFGDFLYIVQTAQWEKINWVNLTTSLIVLFAVEFLIKLQGVIKQIIEDIG